MSAAEFRVSAEVSRAEQIEDKTLALKKAQLFLLCQWHILYIPKKG